jgi:hypothetical protein
MRFQRNLAWVLLPLLFLGCGKSGPKVVPVSGLVTLDKKPVANADIVFSPSGSGGDKSANLESSGRTDAQGRYSLRMIQDKREGTLAGTYKVRISLMERGTSLINRLPKSYNQNTTLTFTVPAEGTTEANFDLTSDGRGK